MLLVVDHWGLREWAAQMPLHKLRKNLLPELKEKWLTLSCFHKSRPLRKKNKVQKVSLQEGIGGFWSFFRYTCKKQSWKPSVTLGPTSNCKNELRPLSSMFVPRVKILVLVVHKWTGFSSDFFTDLIKDSAKTERKI